MAKYAAIRFDKYGEIRLIAKIIDPGTRKPWFVVKRKGGAKPLLINEVEWGELSEQPTKSPLAPRLTIYGVV
jgi:hypothetical protein